MFRRFIVVTGLIGPATLSLGVTPYQAEPPFGIPWWVWLLAVAIILLISLGIILSFDWRDAGQRGRDTGNGGRDED